METKILEVKVDDVTKYIPLFKKDGVWVSKSKQGFVWWDPEDIKQFCLMDDLYEAEEVLKKENSDRDVLTSIREALKEA